MVEVMVSKSIFYKIPEHIHRLKPASAWHGMESFCHLAVNFVKLLYSNGENYGL
jgi:hypothetical protein